MACLCSAFDGPDTDQALHQSKPSLGDWGVVLGLQGVYIYMYIYIYLFSGLGFRLVWGLGFRVEESRVFGIGAILR